MTPLNLRTGLTASLSVLALGAARAQFDVQLPLQYGWQQTVGNPAALQDHKVTVALPSFSGGYRMPFSANDLGEVRDGTLWVDADQAINRLADRGNDQRASLTGETLAFNYRHKRYQFGASHRVRATGHLDLPRGLAQLAAYGNAPFVGERLQTMPTVNLAVFDEFALHGSIVLKHNLTVGVRGKFLRGTAAAQTTVARAEIYTEPLTYATSVETDIVLHTAGAPVDFTRTGAEVGELEGYGGAGLGVGLDVGMVYRPLEELEVGLSIRDMGAITWSDGVRHRSNGSFEFRGYEGNVFEGDGGEVNFDVAGTVDSILAEVEFVSEDEVFRTSLPTTIQATGRYSVAKLTTVHATAYAADAGVWHGGFGLGVGQRFGEWVHAGVLAGMRTGGGFVGANLLVDVYGVQLYAACDDLVPVFNLNDAKSAHFRAGLNLAFGQLRGRKNVVGWYDLKVEGINK